MEYLEAKMTSGEVDGIRILDSLTICHKLFAYDVGVFIPTMEESFGKLQSILKLYKLASGAKLNLSKYVIVPLALPSIPNGWPIWDALSVTQVRFKNTWVHLLALTSSHHNCTTFS